MVAGAGGTCTLSSKADCLLDALKVIRERGESGEGTGKVVIFTESVKTQEFLFELLASNGYLPTDITLFRGQNELPQGTNGPISNEKQTERGHETDQ